MSIINKMHKGLKESVIDSPVLMSLPEKKTKYKALLLGFISLLFVSSIALSVLIYNQRNDVENIAALVLAADSSVANTLATTKTPAVSSNASPSSMPSNPPVVKKEVIINEEVRTNQQLAVRDEMVVYKEALINQQRAVNDEIVVNKNANIDNETVLEEKLVADNKKVTTDESAVNSPKNTIEEKALKVKAVTNKKMVIDEQEPAKMTLPLSEESDLRKQALPIKKSVVKEKKASHLEIKKSTLTPSELANTHLKKAEQALEEGDNFLASKEKRQALNIKPDLHDVRKTLALYHYSIGEQGQAVELLKKGAFAFPEYSDFNLMLSRIALKSGDQQKAYLYLNQHPPVVEGHLDYHASYAILAQKFNKYEQAEQLYQGILKYRPDNGRWLMSLAIMQDKQGKKRLAISHYQKALEQIDLSSKAKQYINQRLIYLSNQ